MLGPRLTAVRLIRRNRSAAAKTRLRILAVAGYCAMLVSMWAGREWLAQAIDWVRLHGLVCGGLAAVACAIQVARRRELTRTEFARSWLAAVPIGASAHREALIIETLPATAALVTLMVTSLTCGLIFAIARAGHGDSLLAAWAVLSTGVAIGVVVSYALPAPKPVDLPPGSRYVPHPKYRRAAKLRPSLAALGAWPVRQMFAWAQPKIVARATVPVLVMMPLGTTADRAMSAIAVFGVTGALVLLWMAVTSISRQVRRWTVPLPVQAGLLMRALLMPTLAVMAGASALEFLLLLTFDVPYRSAAAAGVGTAVIGCAAALIGAQEWRLPPGRSP